MTKENLIYRLNLHIEDGDIFAFTVHKNHIFVHKEEVHLITTDQDLKEQYYNIFKDQL